MRALLLITGKDLRQRVRDRSVFLFAIVVPFALAAVMSLVFGNTDEELDIAYGVVDADGSDLSAAFTQVVEGLEAGGVATVTTLDDADAARAQVAAGDLDAAFLVPEGFGAAATGGQPAAIEVVGHVDSTLGVTVAESVASSFASDVTGRQLVAATVLATAPDGSVDPARLAALAGGDLPSPVTVVDGRVADEQLDMRTYLSAGMAIFFLFFTVQFGVLTMLEERQHGTLQRLRAAPVPRWAVVGAKGLTSFVLGVVSMAVLVIGSALLLGASWGDPVGMALLIVAGVLAAVGIVTIVVLLARTTEQAEVWQTIISVGLGALGGVFFPVSQIGGVLETLSALTPHQWFLRGVGALQEGGPADVLPAVGAILGFAATAFAIAGIVAATQWARSRDRTAVAAEVTA